MNKKIKFSAAVLLLAAVVACVCAFLLSRRGPETDDVEDGQWDDPVAVGDAGWSKQAAVKAKPPSAKEGDEDVADEVEEEEEEEPQTEEEKREAAEEALVDAFDDLTDKWTEPAEKGVSMADVDKFVAQFRKVPADRRDECLHRALNLVPDENVMLLAGILMDKQLGKETVETVFNDILNRDEEVKKPVLLQVFKDKSHPCWEDAAWILDVTDELPNQDKKQ